MLFLLLFGGLRDQQSIPAIQPESHCQWLVNLNPLPQRTGREKRPYDQGL